jgi:syringate O-demethylase
LPRPLPAIYSGEKMKSYREWLTENAYETTSPLGGSFHSENIEDYYFTPYELDYGRIIGFDHDFIGREALEKMVAQGKTERRKKVTFVWNGDDTAAAYGSMFHKGPGAKFINLPMSLYDTFHADRVEANGKVVGLSTWTGYSAERARDSVARHDRRRARKAGHGSDDRLGRGQAVGQRRRSRTTCRSRSARRSCRRRSSSKPARSIARMPA